MPLITKPNYNQIFASQAPEQDKPAVFNNYPSGWGVESRPNNGKPTIKGFNYLQQTSDLKDLWILQNGACLPYDESIEYAEGAPVLKDGVIQYKTLDGFSPVASEKPYTLNYFSEGVLYPLNARVTLDNGDIVKSTVAGNAANPNVDMTGWVRTNAASQIVDESGKTQQELNDYINDQFILVESFKKNSDNYIDDALDDIKAELLTKGAMSGGTLMLPRGIWRISRSHDLSVTGLRLAGDGGRYASRIVADADGDYSAGYVLKIAPTTGQVISGGSGLEKVTIDLNEAPAIGLIYQGAYDVSALDRAEVINGHKDYPCAVIEPHPDGTVIQTLKLDTSGFSKKSVGGTGYVVEVRMAQECIIINSKMFGSPSNQATKGSVPLLLENCRGIQIIGGGLANSETNCIHIYAKTRNTTHVTIIGPTFEGYKAKAIKTFAESGFTVSRLVVMNERMITPSAGLLEGGSLTFSTIYACNADIELLAGSTNNVIHTFDKSKVVDNGTYNEVIETPSMLNGNTHVSNRSQAAVMVTTPQFILGVVGRTGNYAFRWDASASSDVGASFMTPNGSKPIRFLDDRLGFFGTAPIVQRISPSAGLTDTQKISAVILALEQLGLFKPAT